MTIVEPSDDDAVREKATSFPHPTICLISYSAIADDPRVRRQGDAFSEAGWKVYAVGLPGARSTPPAWAILTQDDLELAPPVEKLTVLPDFKPRYEAADKSIARDTISAPDGQLQPGVQKTAADIPATTSSSDWPRIRRIYQRIAPAPLRARLYTLRTSGYTPKNWFRAKLACLNNANRIIADRSGSFVGRSMSNWLIQIFARVVFALGPWRHRAQLLKPIARQFMMRVNRDDGPEFYLDVPEIRRLYDVSRLVKADIYLANDWHTLPIAMRAARESGGHFGYDTHEYALEEYRYRLSWRLFRRPLARSVEMVGLRKALVASTVSEGIAEDMASEYDLPKPLLVIRNTPDRQQVETRPCTGTIKVLFHGLIASDRGLEDCIRSVSFWRPEFKFLLRGPATPEYRAKLEAIAMECGVTDKVEFLAPVPMTDLVLRAAEADIGISTPPKTSKHNIYALPNKFFEYIQAGLALAIADLPDMGRIVKQYDLGRLIPEVAPESIAQTINAFTVDNVNRYKQNSLKAAGELNWQVEQQRLVGAYADALTRVRRTVGIKE